MGSLQDRVVVLTGASSGLGRAVAVELAGRGCALVLAARRIEALEETARLCRAAGGRAICQQTDVTVQDEVDLLTTVALDEYGRIDVWINNAGVTMYSKLEDGPREQHKRVIETNLFGAIYGAQAVVPVFRKQHRGILINVGSVLSEVGQAFVPSYVISKFGVHGLSEALRVELADEPDIHVCTVFPYAIDTPHFEVAANYFGQMPRAMPPVQSPEHVARAVAQLIERPRRARYVPRSVVLGLTFHRLMPRTAEHVLLDALRRFHLSKEPQRIGEGNLYTPPAQIAKVHGERPPMIRTLPFLGWVAARLVRNAAVAVGRVPARISQRLARRRLNAAIAGVA